MEKREKSKTAGEESAWDQPGEIEQEKSRAELFEEIKNLPSSNITNKEKIRKLSLCLLDLGAYHGFILNKEEREIIWKATLPLIEDEGMTDFHLYGLLEFLDPEGNEFEQVLERIWKIKQANFRDEQKDFKDVYSDFENLGKHSIKNAIAKWYQAKTGKALIQTNFQDLHS